MKLVALIPVHTSLPVAGLTIGSFLRQHRRHDVEVHVGVHSNYDQYTADLGLFEELKGVAQVHKVDEIDWMGEYNKLFYRYSVMHAKSLENLMRKVERSDFDYAVILDHDLHVKTDFVTKCVERHPGADLIGALTDDKDAIWPFTTHTADKVNCLPKISVWHLLVSRKLLRAILGQPSMLYPKLLKDDARKAFIPADANLEDLPLFVDTFAEVLNRCNLGGMGKVGLIKSDEFAGWVTHFYASSFNYGLRIRKNYEGHISEIEKIYHQEFPEGLGEFRRDSLTVAQIHANLLKGLAMVAEQQATITFNNTPDLPPNVRDREMERLSTALMVAKAMCVTAGIEEGIVRTITEVVFQKEKTAWESFILARGK